MSEDLKHKTKIGFYWKFFEQFSNYGVQFIVGIIMARLLSPSDFGIAALPAVFIAVAQVFIDSGFALALIRKPEVSEKDLATSFYYCIVVGLSLYVVLFLLAPYIATFYGEPILVPLIRVSTLTFLFNPLLTPQSVILNRKLNFKTPAKVTVFSRILSGVLGICVAYCGFGIWALVATTLSASILTVLLTSVCVRWIPKEKWSKDSFQYLWNFGNKMVGAGLLRTIYANIVPVLLGKFGGTAQLGVYNRAIQFASLPSANFIGIINTVTFPVLSKMVDNPEQLKCNFEKLVKASSFVVFPIMLIMSALAEPLIITLITDKWANCIPVLQIMCFTYMFQPVHILNVNLLQVMGRPDLILKLEIISKCIFPIFIVLAVQQGIIVLCIVDFLITMISLVLNTYYSGKLLCVGYIKQVRYLLPSFILSLAMMVVVLIVISFIENTLIQLLAGSIIGLSFYFGAAYLFRFEELQDVKYMINRKK